MLSNDQILSHIVKNLNRKTTVIAGCWRRWRNGFDYSYRSLTMPFQGYFRVLQFIQFVIANCKQIFLIEYNMYRAEHTVGFFSEKKKTYRLFACRKKRKERKLRHRANYPSATWAHEESLSSSSLSWKETRRKTFPLELLGIALARKHYYHVNAIELRWRMVGWMDGCIHSGHDWPDDIDLLFLNKFK